MKNSQNEKYTTFYLFLIFTFNLCNCKFGPRKVKLIEVDCSELKSQLHIIDSIDRQIRLDGLISPEDEEVDFKNLTYVVSAIEKCGMPSKQEIGKKGISAIMMVLQHSDGTEYTFKYLPYFEALALKGEIEYEMVALMKDRINLHLGKPQIYGTQIVNGKLYKLFEPEFVDLRRQEKGMEPLKDYLKYFNINFDIPQKNNN